MREVDACLVGWWGELDAWAAADAVGPDHHAFELWKDGESCRAAAVEHGGEDGLLLRRDGAVLAEVDVVVAGRRCVCLCVAIPNGDRSTDFG